MINTSGSCCVILCALTLGVAKRDSAAPVRAKLAGSSKNTEAGFTVATQYSLKLFHLLSQEANVGVQRAPNTESNGNS